MTSDSSAWNLITGTATKYLLLGVNLTVGLFLMPFTIRHLGTADYGLWMLVASFTYYFQLLDLGYGNGLVRQVAQANARNDVNQMNALLSTFVVVYGVIGLAAAAGIAALILGLLPHFPRLRAEDVSRAQLLLALIGVRLVISFPMTVFGAATTARQRFALNNLVATAVALLNGVVTYVVLVSGGRLVALVASTTALSLASYAAYAWTAHRAFPELRLRMSLFSRPLVREVTTFSAYVFILDIAIQVGFNLDNLIIAASLGTSAVAVYAVALRLADSQRQLCNQFNGLLFPMVVRYGAGGQTEALRTMLVEGTRIALTLVTGVTVCVIGLGAPLIAVWMGPGFEASLAPLYVLALTGIVLVGQGPLGNILLGTGRHRLVALTSLGEAAANLVLSLILVRRYGSMGVAIGTAVPVVAANLFILFPAACRHVGMSVASVARSVLVAPTVGVVPAVLALGVLRALVPPDSYARIVCEGVLTGLVYMAAVWAIGFDGELRTRYRAYVRELWTAGTLGRLSTAQV